jgi:hypothetical protein
MMSGALPPNISIKFTHDAEQRHGALLHVGVHEQHALVCQEHYPV